MNISRLQMIQDVFDDAVKSNQIAGMNCAVFQNGKELGYWQSGFADIENKKPFNRDTICRLYSMTKPVTNVAAWILIEKGKMELCDEVGRYLPEFWNLQVCDEVGKGRDGKSRKSSRCLLIQDLLNMTSGYTYGAWWDGAPLGEHLTSDLLNELNEDVKKDLKITTQNVAERLAKIPVSFEPGTNFCYGLSADIMGAVIEKVSGMRFSDFLKKNIFEPLGMNDTDFYVPEEKYSRLARTYDKKDDKLVLFTSPHLGIQGEAKRKPAFESGGAGLCSTLDDYAKFAQMLSNKGEFNGKRILQSRTVEFFSKAHLRDNLQKCFDNCMEHLSGYSYANFMRVCVDEGKVKMLTERGEFGWDGWLGPFVSMDIKNNLTIVYMMQLCGSGLTNCSRKMKNIVYSSL